MVIRKKQLFYFVILLMFFARMSPLIAQAELSPEARRGKTFSSKYDHDAAPLIQTKDGGYIIVGAGTWGDEVIKTDPNGKEEWVKTFRKPNSFISSNYVQQIKDRGYIIAGWTVKMSGKEGFARFTNLFRGGSS